MSDTREIDRSYSVGVFRCENVSAKQPSAAGVGDELDEAAGVAGRECALEPDHRHADLMPWVRIDKQYIFDTDQGEKTLRELEAFNTTYQLLDRAPRSSSLSSRP